MNVIEYSRLYPHPGDPAFRWTVYRVVDRTPFGGLVGYVRRLGPKRWTAYPTRWHLNNERSVKTMKTRWEAADYLVRVADNNATASLTGHWQPLPEDGHWGVS